MTAPAGAIVSLYVDLVAQVNVDDIIETQSGRRYQALAVRVQQRGKHVGRQHLRVRVLGEDESPLVDCANRSRDGFICSAAEHGSDDCCAYFNEHGSHEPVVHRIRWYVRGRGRR